MVGSRCRVGIDATRHEVRQVGGHLYERLEENKLSEIVRIIAQNLFDGPVEPNVLVDSILEGPVARSLGEPDEAGTDALVGVPEEDDGVYFFGTCDLDICGGVAMMPYFEIRKEDAEKIVCERVARGRVSFYAEMVVRSA